MPTLNLDPYTPDTLRPNNETSRAKDPWKRIVRMPETRENPPPGQVGVPASGWTEQLPGLTHAPLEFQGKWVSWGDKAPPEPRYTREPTLVLDFPGPVHVADLLFGMMPEGTEVKGFISLHLPTSTNPEFAIPMCPRSMRGFIYPGVPPNNHGPDLYPAGFPRHLVHGTWLGGLLETRPQALGPHDPRLWALIPWKTRELFQPTHHRKHRKENERYLAGYLWTPTPFGEPSQPDPPGPGEG